MRRRDFIALLGGAAAIRPLGAHAERPPERILYFTYSARYRHDVIPLSKAILTQQFVHPQNGPVAMQMAVLGFLFVVMGALSTALVAFCAGSLSKLLQKNPVILRWQSKAVGLVYCTLGIRLAFQER